MVAEYGWLDKRMLSVPFVAKEFEEDLVLVFVNITIKAVVFIVLKENNLQSIEDYSDFFSGKKLVEFNKL